MSTWATHALLASIADAGTLVVLQHQPGDATRPWTWLKITEQLPAAITYHELTEGIHTIAGVRVAAQFLNHPAMTLGYRHPMGPLRSSDLVGHDVRLAIAEYLARTLGERFTPPQLLRDKVAAGELGRSTGKGFYTYDG